MKVKIIIPVAFCYHAFGEASNGSTGMLFGEFI